MIQALGALTGSNYTPAVLCPICKMSFKKEGEMTFLLEKNKVNSSLADNDDRNFSSVLQLEGCSDILEGMNNNGMGVFK